MGSYYVATNETEKRVYHTDKDCSQLRTTATERTKTHVERMGLELCKRCDGDDRDYPNKTRKALRWQV